MKIASFCCFLCKNAFQNISEKKKRFLRFFKSLDWITKTITRKTLTSTERKRHGLSKGATFFFKYAFLLGVKNRRKRVKIRPFGNGFHL